MRFPGGGGTCKQRGCICKPGGCTGIDFLEKPTLSIENRMINCVTV